MTGHSEQMCCLLLCYFLITNWNYTVYTERKQMHWAKSLISQCRQGKLVPVIAVIPHEIVRASQTPVLIHTQWGPTLILIVQHLGAHCFPVCWGGGCCNIFRPDSAQVWQRGAPRAHPLQSTPCTHGHQLPGLLTHHWGLAAAMALRSGAAIAMNNGLQYLSISFC